MSPYGLLVNFKWCTGCHSCEVACMMERKLPPEKCGINVVEVGPIQVDEDKYILSYIPTPTDICNLCEERTKRGLIPICVKHCQAGVMKFGTIEELARYMKIQAGTVLWRIIP